MYQIEVIMALISLSFKKRTWYHCNITLTYTDKVLHQTCYLMSLHTCLLAIIHFEIPSFPPRFVFSPHHRNRYFSLYTRESVGGEETQSGGSWKALLVSRLRPSSAARRRRFLYGRETERRREWEEEGAGSSGRMPILGQTCCLCFFFLSSSLRNFLVFMFQMASHSIWG